jgi:hypothetical protein
MDKLSAASFRFFPLYVFEKIAPVAAASAFDLSVQGALCVAPRDLLRFGLHAFSCASALDLTVGRSLSSFDFPSAFTRKGQKLLE